MYMYIYVTSIEEDLRQAMEKRRMEKEKEMQEKRKVGIINYE